MFDPARIQLVLEQAGFSPEFVFGEPSNEQRRYQYLQSLAADPRKGERIVLVTTDQTLDRDRLQQAARAAGVSELMVPADVLHRPELPLLGTGKTDYPSVQQIVTGYLAAA